MSFIDDALNLIKSATKIDIRAQVTKQLQDAQLSLESKLGDFLKTGKQISDAVGLAQAQQNSSDGNVRSRAVALVAQGNALLTNFQAIQVAATTVAGQLTTLISQVQSDPSFNLFSNDVTGMGTRVAQLYDQYKTQVTTLVSSSTSVVSRAATHMAQTQQFLSDVNALQAQAQGKGISGLLSGVGGALNADVKPLVWIAGIGAAVWLLGPSLLGRTLRARR